ncbi:hypothetical protein FACS1894164_02070 [Spirochaetia bacterium]|nr:hypothetical protein FACS1894164_02070 [Spirochaetia bacterium]
MMKKIVVVYFLIVCALPVFAFGAKQMRMIDPFIRSSPRTDGMGGNHIAAVSGVDALLINPAALHISKSTTQFASLSIETIGPIFDIVGSANILGAMGGIAQKAGGKIPLGINIQGPLSFAMVNPNNSPNLDRNDRRGLIPPGSAEVLDRNHNDYNGFGWGIFDYVSADIRILGTTQVNVKIAMDFVIPFGMSARLADMPNYTVDFGFSVKALTRLWYHNNDNPLSVFDIADDNFDFGTYISGLKSNVFIGGGFNLGFLYRLPAYGLSFALTANDFAAGLSYLEENPAITQYAIPVLNIGAAWQVPVFNFLDLTLMLTYYDFNNLFYNDYITKNPILNLNAGIELKFWDTLFLRAGIQDMLLSVGLGVEYGIFQFDAAFHGTELGNEPGSFTTYALDIGFSFRL